MSLSFATYIRWETEPKLSSRQNNRSKQVFMAYSIGIFDQKSSNKLTQLQRQARKVFLRATSFTIVL